MPSKGVVKAKKKCPQKIKNTLAATSIVSLMLYCTLGLNKLLIFLFGMLTLIVIQAAIIFRYIVRENAKAQAQKEAEERKSREDDFFIIGRNQLQDDYMAEQAEEESKRGSQAGHEMPDSERRRDFQDRSSGAPSEAIDLNALEAVTDAHAQANGLSNLRNRFNSDEGLATQSTNLLDSPALHEDQEALEKMSQDRAPPISNEADNFNVSPRRSRLDQGVRTSDSHRSRAFERPAFLTECFEEVEPQFFYMFEKCQCHKRRNNEIQRAFMGKQQSLLDGLKVVTRFFEQISTQEAEVAKFLQTLGAPSKSFLGSQTHSMLFDSEHIIFKELLSQEDTIHNSLMFCDIRSKYQQHGKILADKSTEWLQEVQVGQLSQAMEQVQELGAKFEEQFQARSQQVIQKVTDLHQREVVYRETEDKLIQLIVEYRELINYDEATKLQIKQQASSFSKEKEAQKQEATKRRTFAELVNLESQCKITNFQLNQQSQELKDAQNQMNETLEECERFKTEMLEQLHELTFTQAKLMLSSMKLFLGWFDEHEARQLEEFKQLLECPPRLMMKQRKELSPSIQPKKGYQDLMRNDTLIEVDDFEEANLSEYASGGATPMKNDCDRYSNLRASSGSHKRKQERSNSDLATSGLRLEEKKKIDSLSNRVQSKSQFRKNAGAQLEDEVSIQVFEPSDKSPICDGEVTPQKVVRRGSERKLMGTQQSAVLIEKHEPLVVDIDEGNLSEADCDVKIDIVKKTMAEDSMSKLSPQNLHFNQKIRVSSLVEQTKTGKEQFKKACEDLVKDQSQLAEMSLAIDELVKYLNDLAEVNMLEHSLKKVAIDSQFKEIKNVITAGQLNLDNLHDEDSLRENIALQQDLALTRTDSNKYGPSTFILMLQSDFHELCAYWEEQLDQQKLVAEQHEITANQLQNQAVQVQQYFEEVQTDLQDKYREVDELKDTVTKLQDEVEAIEDDLKVLEERRRVAEEEANAKEQIQEEAVPHTPLLGAVQVNVESPEPLISTNASTKLAIPRVSSHQDTLKGTRGHNAGSNYNLRSLLRPTGTPEEQKKAELGRSFPLDQNSPARDGQASESHARIRSQSVDNIPKIKGLPSKKSTNSFSIMSIENEKLAIENQVKDITDDTNELVLAKSISQEKRALSPPVPAKVEETKQSGIGYFFSMFTQVFVSEKQLQSKEELEKNREEKQAELEKSQLTYLRAAKDLLGNFKATKQLMQNRLMDWKRGLLTTEIDKLRLVLKHTSAATGQAQLTVEDLRKDEIHIVVKTFLWKKGNQISYHEPHCANYRLFNLKEADNPFSIKIENVDLTNMATNEETKRTSNEGYSSFDPQADTQSVTSVNIADNRSSTTGILTRASKFNINDRESCDWVNDLLAVFWEAWADAKVFHDLVLDAIYNSVNLERDESLAEIKCKAMQLEGKPPRIIWVKNASVQNPATQRPCFTVEGDVVVPGDVKILIETAYKINWPAYNWTSIPLELFIIVSRISGRIRFQYSNDVEHHGGSYLQFLGKPAVTVKIEPVIFKRSPINLKSIPTVKTILKDIISGVIEDLCFPSRVELSVPCVLDPIYIDEQGRRITQAAAKSKQKEERKE